MRIAVMVHLYPPRHNAGAEWMLHSMLRPLADRGHQVDVIVSRPVPAAEPYQLDGVNVWPRRSKGDPIPFVRDAGLVVAHLENVPRAEVLARSFGKPLAVVCHNTMTHTSNQLTASTDLVVFNSEWMRAALGDHPNGIVVRPPVFAAEYATQPGDRVTLVNLTPTKGGLVFWDLARRMTDVEFLAVHGAYGQQIVQSLPNVDVLDHVSGHDMREAVYGRTRILLMPSDYESWGRVGVEAMCSGIPVIAHPTEGLRESLGDAGVFVDRDDIDGWERQIRRLLDGRAWRAASRRALTRAAELDPAPDIDRWVSAVERFGGKRHVAA